MTHEEKIKYMEIAGNITRLHLSMEQMDLMISLYELITEKSGEADLRDIVRIESEAAHREIRRTNQKNTSNTVDVSKMKDTKEE